VEVDRGQIVLGSLEQVGHWDLSESARLLSAARVRAGQVHVNDGRHRLAVAAERGQQIDVAVRDKNAAAELRALLEAAEPAPAPPRFEQTERGPQALIPGTPARGLPPKPTRARRPQRSTDELPLFGQVRDAEQRAADAAQGSLFTPSVPEEPTPTGDPAPSAPDDLSNQDAIRAIIDGPRIGTTSYRLADTARAMPPELIELIATSPRYAELARVTHNAFALLQDRLTDWNTALYGGDFVGFGTDYRYLGATVRHPAGDRLVFNPWVMSTMAHRDAAAGRIGANEIPQQIAHYFAATLVHEIVHVVRRGHDESFAVDYTCAVARVLPQIRETVETLTRALEANDGAIYQQLAADTPFVQDAHEGRTDLSEPPDADLAAARGSERDPGGAARGPKRGRRPGEDLRDRRGAGRDPAMADDPVRGGRPGPGAFSPGGTSDVLNERGAIGGSRPTPPTAPPGTPLADIDAMARPPRRRTVADMLRRGRDRVYETQVNQFEPLRQLGRLLENAGAPAERGESPVEMAELAANRARGQALVFARRLGRIYREAHDAGLENALNQYLTLKQFAKRIRDLQDRGLRDGAPIVDADGRRLEDGGFVNPREFDLPKIDDGLNQLIDELGLDRLAEVERLAAGVWALNRDVLERARDAGLVSEGLYAHLTSRGEDYVPMHVLDYITEVGEARAAAKPYDVKYQSVVKRMEGTERDVRNVLESSLEKAVRALSQINRNRAARAVTDLHRVLPDVITRVEGESVPGDRVVVHAFVDGKRTNYAVPPDVARAMQFLDADTMGAVAAILRVPKEILQAGATGANIAFALTNLQRDLKRAAVYSRYGVKAP